MPAYKRRRTPSRGRRVGRKRTARKTRRPSNKRRRTVARMTPAPISDAMYMKMKYCDSIRLTSAATPVYHIFNVNSLFDPDYSATGHQPFGYDQWMGTSFTTGWYNKYRVSGVSYKITFNNLSTAYLMSCAVVGKINTTVSTDMNTIFEKPRSQCRTMGYGSGSAARAFMRGYFSAAQLLGVTAEEYRTDDKYAGDVTSSPLISPYLHLYIFEPSVGVAGLGIDIQVELTYHTYVYSRVPIVGSV